MKKTLLSVALASCTIPALAAELHGGLSGMSNAGYSTGNYSEGVLLNPSLGASYDPEKDDFALLLSFGALASDKDELVEQSDDLVDLLDAIDAAGTITSAQAEDLKARLESIDGDNAVVNVGANFVLSIPTDFVSLAVIASSRASISLSPDLADSDLDLIDQYIDGNINPSNFDSSDLVSTIDGYGAVVTDLGVSFSKAFQLNNGTHLLVGFKPKKTEVESIIYTSDVADFDEDDFDADQYTYTDSAMNYDLGVTYMAGKMRYGLVANNLQSKTFQTIDPDETITIERQLTSSIGYVSGHFKAEAAVDLNSVAALSGNGEVQLMRAGIEYSAWDWLRLRAGLQQDTKNTMEDTYSFGVGLGAFNLAYITGSENTEGFALSGGLRF